MQVVKRVKKQIITDDLIYRELKAALILQDKTVSDWFEEKARQELREAKK